MRSRLPADVQFIRSRGDLESLMNSHVADGVHTGFASCWSKERLMIAVARGPRNWW